MSYKLLNKTIDMLNNGDKENDLNNESKPSKTLHAKKFYGSTAKSKVAKNMEQQMTSSSELTFSKAHTPSSVHSYSRRPIAETLGICKGLSPTKIRRILRSPSQNRFSAKNLSLHLGGQKDDQQKLLLSEGSVPRNDSQSSYIARFHTDPHLSSFEKRSKRHLMPVPKPRKLYFSDTSSQNRPLTKDFRQENNQKLCLVSTTNEPPASSQCIGFPNKGLTCYLNATLQALLAQPYFSKSLLCLERKIKKWLSDNGMLKPLCHLARWKNEKNPEKIDQCLSWFRRRLVQKCPRFNGIRNQDAHEFLVVLFEAIEEQCKSYAKQISCDKNKSLEIPPKLRPHVQTVIKDFSFQIKETRMCLLCNHKEEHITSNNIFKLVMPSKDIEDKSMTLEALLSNSLNSFQTRKCLVCIEKKRKLGYDKIEDSPHQLTDCFVQLPRYLIVYCPRIQAFKTAQDILDSGSKITFRKNRIPIEFGDSFSMLPFMDIEGNKNPNFHSDFKNVESNKRSNTEQNNIIHLSKKQRTSTDCRGSNIILPDFHNIPDLHNDQLQFSENDRSAVSTKVPNFVPGSISNLDNLNTPNCPLSSPSSPEVSDCVRLFQHEESPNSIALRLCSSGLNSPITPDKTPIKPRVNNIDIFDSPIKQIPLSETPEKLKNLNGDQINKLSETDQIEFAMRESLKTTTFSPHNLLNLTEEEQLAEAINASLRENDLVKEQVQEEEMTKAIDLAIDMENNMTEDQNEKQLLLAIERSKSQCLVGQTGNKNNEDFEEKIDNDVSGI